MDNGTLWIVEESGIVTMDRMTLSYSLGDEYR